MNLFKIRDQAQVLPDTALEYEINAYKLRFDPYYQQTEDAESFMRFQKDLREKTHKEQAEFNKLNEKNQVVVIPNDTIKSMQPVIHFEVSQQDIKKLKHLKSRQLKETQRNNRGQIDMYSRALKDFNMGLNSQQMSQVSHKYPSGQLSAS